jgi:hypothetical protein
VNEVEDRMSEQYLVDGTGKTIGVVVDPDTYQELLTAREELDRLRGGGLTNVTTSNSASEQHSIRDLRGLGKEHWTGLDVQSYIREERDSWDG